MKNSLRFCILLLAFACSLASEQRPFRLPVFDCLKRAELTAHAIATSYCSQTGCVGGGAEWQRIYQIIYEAYSNQCWL